LLLLFLSHVHFYGRRRDDFDCIPIAAFRIVPAGGAIFLLPVRIDVATRPAGVMKIDAMGGHAQWSFDHSSASSEKLLDIGTFT